MPLNGQRSVAQIRAEQDTWLFNGGSAGPTTSNPNTTYPTDAQLLAITNKWYKRFVSKHLWQWNTCEGAFTTTPGQQRYALPDTVGMVQNLTIRNLSKSIPIYTRQKFLAMYPSGWVNTGQGIPMIAVEAPPSTANSRQYDLWPTPNIAYTVNFDGFSYVFPLDGVTYIYPIIPPNYDDFLVHGPISEAFQMQNDNDRSQYHLQIAADIEQRAWLENENMISLINQERGQDADAGQALIFPYHPY